MIAIIVLIIYIVGIFATVTLSMAYDRLHGSSATEVYSDWDAYVGIGVAWPILAPFLLLYLLAKKCVTICIMVIEIVMAIMQNNSKKITSGS